MNESTLRWKGRLGRLKSLALVLGLVGLVLLIAGAALFSAAQRNDPARPAEVTVGQLARGEVPRERYVSVSGWTDYDLWYSETENGSTTARYFVLIDDEFMNLLLVKARGDLVVRADYEPATLTGMTRGAPTALQDMVRSDLEQLQAEGVEVGMKVDLYLAEGQTPPTKTTVLALLVLGGVLLVLAAVPLAMPAAVFGPAPLAPAAAGVAAGEPGTRVSGAFVKLDSMDPLQFGRRTQRFPNAVGNLIPLKSRRLLVYIHHIVTTRTYGIKVSESQTHWGILIGPDNVVAIEPGKLYAWKDRPAVSLRYRDDKGREQELIVSFDHAAAQADFVATLRQQGFTVGSGMPASL